MHEMTDSATSGFSPLARDVAAKGSLRDLFAARDKYLATGIACPSVRPVVRESWGRCRDYGVDPKHLRHQPFDATRLGHERDRNRSLIEAVEPYLRLVHQSLASQPHLVALADADGFILSILTDRAAEAEAVQSGNLFEGASWHERDIGCNGIGTSLAVGQPLILIGPEHFQESYVGWTCIGIPLRDATGVIIGALDLSVPNEFVNPHTWGWVLSIGRAIEAGIAAAGGGNKADAPLDELENPLNVVRGVLDLVARQVELSTTHAKFLEEARSGLEAAAGDLRSALASALAAQERLKAADRHKDRFIAVLAHELRNPLNAMSLSLQLLGRGPADPATVNEAREMMGREVDFMVRLVGDLLDFARIKQGKLDIHSERLDLGRVAADAVASCRSLYAEKRHDLNVSLPLEPLWVLGDPVRLRQVLANLLTNAAKYTEQGGRIEFILVAEDGVALVTVRDNGIGIPPEKLAQVFDLFAQVNESIQHSQGGLGIGLALVKSIAEMHGGSVVAKSHGPGQGSEFLVRLPVCAA